MIRERLEENRGENWIVVGIPKPVYDKAKDRADSQNYNAIVAGIADSQVTIWDCVILAECQEVVTYGKNWSELFEAILVRPQEAELPGDKNKKTEWITRLNAIVNKLTKPSYSVSTAEYALIKEVYDWLILRD